MDVPAKRSLSGISTILAAGLLLSTSCVARLPGQPEEGAGEDTGDYDGDDSGDESDGSTGGSEGTTGTSTGTAEGTTAGTAEGTTAGTADGEDLDTTWDDGTDCIGAEEGPFDTGSDGSDWSDTEPTDTGWTDTTDGGWSDDTTDGGWSDDTTDGGWSDDTTDGGWGDDTTDGGNWNETGGFDTEGNNEFTTCGPLVMDWDLSLSLGTNFAMVDSVDRRADGGLVAVATAFDDAWLVNISAEGQQESSAPRSIDMGGEGTLALAHAIANPGGGLTWASAESQLPFVASESAGFLELWSWTSPQAADAGLITTGLARLSNGGSVVVGENFVDNDSWMQLLDAQGQPTASMLGGPLATQSVFSAHLNGVAVDSTGDIVVSGWQVQPGFNDLWVARFDSAGTLMWETELSGNSGGGGGLVIDDQGSIFAAFSDRGLYKLSPEGEELWFTTISTNAATLTILDGHEPIMTGEAGGQRTLWRFDNDGTPIEEIGLQELFLVSAAPGDGCTLAFGGHGGRVVQVHAEVL